MNEEIVLNAEKIYKRFGGILALNGVSFELKKGEVHALMGENGAGKSTLAKIFAGIETPDDGAIFVKQKAVHFQSISDALEEGISIVLQEFNLIPHLSVAENLFLNHEKMTKWNLFLNRKVMIDETNKLLDLFDMRNNIDPMTPINELSVAEMQIIEILKAVSINSEIIILDEPTAALSNSEVTRLFEIIRDLKDKGVSFIIVSHRFNEIFEISDRITVLRDGNLIVHGENIKNMTEQKLVKSMVGREIKDLFGDRGQRQKFTNKPLLEVQEIIDSTGYLKEISFSVHKGEVLGIAGLVGSGRTELVNCIFGADKPQKGKIMIDGKQVDAIIISPTDSSSAPAVLNAAKEAGIPVIIADIGTDSGEYESLIISENEKGAREVGEYLAEYMKEQGWDGPVGQVTISLARKNGQLRTAGFESAMTENGFEIADIRQLEDYTRAEAEGFAQDLLTAYPNIRAIFGQTDEPALGVLKAVEGANKLDEVAVVGFDATPETKLRELKKEKC